MAEAKKTDDYIADAEKDMVPLTFDPTKLSDDAKGVITAINNLTESILALVRKR